MAPAGPAAYTDTGRPPRQDSPPCDFVSLLLLCSAGPALAAGDPWVVYDGGDGPGKGKHVVLVCGDEEYRSEEALPQLGKILATRHGFKCTVLFAIDPRTAPSIRAESTTSPASKPSSRPT